MRMTTTGRAFLRATSLGVASAALPARAQPASPASLVDFPCPLDRPERRRTAWHQAALTTEEKQQILIGNGRRLLEAKGVKT
jgi:hypothetical protein